MTNNQPSGNAKTTESSKPIVADEKAEAAKKAELAKNAGSAKFTPANIAKGGKA